MAIDTKSKKIGGVVYRVRQLPSGQALDLWERLMILAAPAAAGSVESVGLANSLQQSVTFGGSAVIKGLGGALNGKVLRTELVDVFRPTSHFIDPKDDRVQPELSKDEIFDEHFAGRISELFEWLGFCLEVNFGDFGEMATKLLGPVAGMVAKLGQTPSPDPSQKESTGPSGDSSQVSESPTV